MMARSVNKQPSCKMLDYVLYIRPASRRQEVINRCSDSAGRLPDMMSNINVVNPKQSIEIHGTK